MCFFVRALQDVTTIQILEITSNMSRVTDPSPQEEQSEPNPEVEFDPNSLWSSPYDTVRVSETPINIGGSNTGMGIIDSSMLADDPIEIVNGLMLGIEEFWTAGKDEFKDFWAKMRHESRENFIRDVYPTIVQSIEDRYCVIEGQKVYEGRYDRFLLLAPHITVNDIREGNALIDMIEGMASQQGLFFMATEQILKLRELVAEASFPLTEAEEEAMKREVPVKKGNLLVVNSPEQFGRYFQIDKPEMATKSIGGEVNLYEAGCLSHQYEFNIVLETLYFAYSVVAALLDEFRAEVQGHRKQKVSRALYRCVACGVKGKASLRKCGKCLTAAYCSK